MKNEYCYLSKNHPAMWISLSGKPILLTHLTSDTNSHNILFHRSHFKLPLSYPIRLSLFLSLQSVVKFFHSKYYLSLLLNEQQDFSAAKTLKLSFNNGEHFWSGMGSSLKYKGVFGSRVEMGWDGSNPVKPAFGLRFEMGWVEPKRVYSL